LHASLEAVRIQSSCKLTKASHQACSSTSCEIGCLSKVDANLKTYLDMLYEVMFDKNSKNRREWWLSVFYSLCIQSYVRKSVIILVSHLGQEDNDGPATATTTANKYLQLVVELFAACNDTGKNMTPSAITSIIRQINKLPLLINTHSILSRQSLLRSPSTKNYGQRNI
jgi:hypothetical protein